LGLGGDTEYRKQPSLPGDKRHTALLQYRATHNCQRNDTDIWPGDFNGKNNSFGFGELEGKGQEVFQGRPGVLNFINSQEP